MRAQEAEADLSRNGLGGLVTVRQRNVEEQGFPAELAGRADAVFLDLPGPWKVRRGTWFLKRACAVRLHGIVVDPQTMEITWLLVVLLPSACCTDRNALSRRKSMKQFQCMVPVMHAWQSS